VPMLLGPVLGPVLGGLIVDSVSWRWIFYVNIPIGIVAIAMAVKYLPGHQKTDRAYRLDVLGFVLLSPGLGLFVYGLSQAGQGSAPSVLVPTVAGAVLVAALVWHALHTKVTPLIEVLLFRDRQFAAASATTFFCRSTTRWCGARRRSPPACSWLRRASARRWSCHWPASSPTASVPDASCPPVWWW
jgi:MFS family permease